MSQAKFERIVELAQRDMLEGNVRSAKDRLRAVLQIAPHFQPALELMGYIYYGHGDYRNAVMYWSRAGFWHDPMKESCDKVFHRINRALVRENTRAVRYLLYAFAGTSPPDEIGDKLSILQAAYYRLNNKKSRLAGLACAPLCGACLLIILGLATVILGAGWSWFGWMATIAGVATAVVMGINTWSYYRAKRLFRDAMDSFERSVGRQSA